MYGLNPQPMLILEAKTSFETLELVPLVLNSHEIEPSFLKLDFL